METNTFVMAVESDNSFDFLWQFGITILIAAYINVS